MADKIRPISDNFSWNLDDTEGYSKWRGQKLAQCVVLFENTQRLDLHDIQMLSQVEKDEIYRRCEVSNAVHYRDTGHKPEPETARLRLRHFAENLGLSIAEKHRSAEKDGIVSLTESESPGKKGYIPYSKRPMNWHTDGYYNGQDQKIRAMVLHCVRSANDGGANQLFDPEIAYIRLRDANPDYITALSHPEAMTIPANDEGNGTIRPESVGPVFSVNPENNKLEMRYTARTRSIFWRDDPMTREAVDFLTRTLASDDPFKQSVQLQPGDGILCNNSLHNRTGFDADMIQPSERLIIRVRFHNRINRR